MTEPLSLATAPELIVATGIEEVRENARNLELTWGLQPATVVSVSGTEVQATYDGDIAAIPMISITSDVLPGDRVMAVFVPPSGNYIIRNFAHRESILLDAIQTNVADTQTTVGAAELDLTRLVSNNILLDTGKLYRTEIQIITNRSVAANEFEFRLRQGSTSGPIVASVIAWSAPNTNGHLVKASLLWVPDSTENTTLHLSVILNSGGGTITVHYSTFGQRHRTQVTHESVGLASQLRTITS